jgi:hypothetical protein
MFGCAAANAAATMSLETHPDPFASPRVASDLLLLFSSSLFQKTKNEKTNRSSSPPTSGN